MRPKERRHVELHHMVNDSQRYGRFALRLVSPLIQIVVRVRRRVKLIAWRC